MRTRVEVRYENADGSGTSGYRWYGPFDTDLVATALLVSLLIKHPTATIREGTEKKDYMGGVDFLRVVTLVITDRTFADDNPTTITITTPTP